MRLTLWNMMAVVSLAVLASLFAILGNDLWQDLARWAITQQRAFQNDMASAIQAIRAGNTGAWTALLVAAPSLQLLSGLAIVWFALVLLRQSTL